MGNAKSDTKCLSKEMQTNKMHPKSALLSRDFFILVYPKNLIIDGYGFQNRCIFQKTMYTKTCEPVTSLTPFN